MTWKQVVFLSSACVWLQAGALCICVCVCLKVCFYSHSWATRSNTGKKKNAIIWVHDGMQHAPGYGCLWKNLGLITHMLRDGGRGGGWMQHCFCVRHTAGRIITAVLCVCVSTSRQLLRCNGNRWEEPVARSELLRGAALNSCSSAPPGLTLAFLIF